MFLYSAAKWIDRTLETETRPFLYSKNEILSIKQRGRCWQWVRTIVGTKKSYDLTKMFALDLGDEYKDFDKISDQFFLETKNFYRSGRNEDINLGDCPFFCVNDFNHVSKPNLSP